MINLRISTEIKGKEYTVGEITGNDIDDAVFTYEIAYVQSGIGMPVSISLPFKEEPFTPAETRCFFEGLLPEGFTRKTVAQWLHADSNDYLQILSVLGKECLGALKVTEHQSREADLAEYEHIGLEHVKALAKEGASKSAELVTRAHISLAGASGKVGLYYDHINDEWYFPKGNAPSTHIVKQSHIRLDAIVPNEQIAMLTAKKLGIEVPDSFIINTGNHTDAEILYATKRYDRIIDKDSRTVNGLPCPHRLHQEDFAQALGISAAAKYEEKESFYVQKAFNLIRNCSVNPIEDQIKLWDIVVFDFLIGNTDAHLKNFSLLYGIDGKGIHLAPAYDLVSTTIYPQSTRDMAFRIGGEHAIDNIKRETFTAAAKEAGIGEKIAMKRFDQLADGFEKALESACGEVSEQGFSNAFSIKNKILKSCGYNNL